MTTEERLEKVERELARRRRLPWLTRTKRIVAGLMVVLVIALAFILILGDNLCDMTWGPSCDLEDYEGPRAFLEYVSRREGGRRSLEQLLADEQLLAEYRRDCRELSTLERCLKYAPPAVQKVFKHRYDTGLVDWARIRRNETGK